jgi:hypothetical protein
MMDTILATNVRGCTESHEHFYFALKKEHMYKSNHWSCPILFHKLPRMIQVLLLVQYDVEYATMLKECLELCIHDHMACLTASLFW